jgi:hypothetical protein
MNRWKRDIWKQELASNHEIEWHRTLFDYLRIKIEMAN